MDATLDLSAYLARIGWRGELRPDYPTLAALLDAHMRHLPFENLDVLLGRPIRLDLPALQDKLVRRRRGGYCFEHATLFAAVLEAIGFAPVRHSARVIQRVPRAQAPRSHMLLTVALPQGRFVLDPGFGGLAPRVPVPLAGGTSAAAHWLTHEAGLVTLHARTPERVVDCWVTTLEADFAVDFEVANHYTSTHPASPFVNRLALQAFTADGRVTVANRECTIWRGDSAQTRELPDRRALRELVARHFGFDLPQIEGLRVPSAPGWDS